MEGSTQAMATDAGTSNGVHEGASSDTIQAPSPLQMYQDAVQQNPLDFNSWKDLIALIEKQTPIDIDLVRRTFDHFLKEFPLCYGYWNKYAELEKKYGLMTGLTSAAINEVVKGVFERGVQAVKYSVDMWLNYIKFLTAQGNTIEPNELRSVFERAIEVVGADPTSGNLWERYIAFEGGQNDFGRVVAVYKRCFYVPLSNLDTIWKQFLSLCDHHPVSVLVPETEYKQLAEENQTTSQEAVKIAMIRKYEAVKDANIAEYARRSSFEQGIRRPYYHVKPLEEDQLRNWRTYLDFEEGENDSRRIEHLYERCLIACANYSEFWIRYADYKEARDGVESAHAVYGRATSTFVKYRSDVHLAFADFMEARGQVEQARAIYRHILDNIGKGLVEAAVKYANFERRQGSREAAVSILSDALAEASGAEAQAYLYIQLSRYQEKVLGNVKAAREALGNALKSIRNNKYLWMARIAFETSHPQRDFFSSVDALYKEAVAEGNQLAAGDRAELMQSHLDFLEDFGPDMKGLRELKSGYQKAAPNIKTGSRKRGSIAMEDSNPNKQARYGDGYYGAAAGTGADYASYQSYDATQMAAYQGYDPAAYAQSYPGYSAAGYSQTATASGTAAVAPTAYSGAAYAATGNVTTPSTGYPATAASQVPATTYYAQYASAQ